jgi:hypothetical protein
MAHAQTNVSASRRSLSKMPMFCVANVCCVCFSTGNRFAQLSLGVRFFDVWCSAPKVVQYHGKQYCLISLLTLDVAHKKRCLRLVGNLLTDLRLKQTRLNSHEILFYRRRSRCPSALVGIANTLHWNDRRKLVS